MKQFTADGRRYVAYDRDEEVIADEEFHELLDEGLDCLEAVEKLKIRWPMLDDDFWNHLAY